MGFLIIRVMSSAPSTPPGENPPEQPLTRRELLKKGFQALRKGAEVTALGAIAAGIGSAVGKTLEEQPKPKPQERKEAAKEAEHQEPEQVPTGLDVGTAGPVIEAFTKHVLIKGSCTPESIADVGAKAGIRMAALYGLGGKAGQERASKEAHEIAQSLIPLPILVALSDATTSALKVNEKAMFEAAGEMAKESKSYAQIERPNLSADASAWQKHLETTNEDLKDKAIDIAAITSVLAPFGTTYTSSALANEMKVEMARILYEQSFALEVLKRKKQTPDQVILDTEIQDTAMKRADELFNGPRGYSKLMVTLSANTQGAWGLGDPPEIYFALRHWNKPARLAKSHAFGLANSEISTILLNASWLQTVGLSSSGLTTQLLSKQAKASQSLLSSLADKDLRNISFGEGTDFAASLEKALQTTDSATAAQEIKKILKAIPKAKMQFSPRDYLRSKLALYKKKGLESKLKKLKVPKPDFSKTGGSMKSPAMLKALFTRDEKTLKALLTEAEEVLQDETSNTMASLFEGITTAGEEQEKAPESISGAAAVAPEATEQSIKMVERLKQLMAGANDPDRERRVERARAILGIKKGDSELRMRQVLSAAGNDTLRQAVAKLVSLEKGEDAIPGADEGTKSGESVAEAAEHAKIPHEDSYLSHSAKEVLYALLTQMTAVPTMTRMAEIIIPKIVGVKGGQAPSERQLLAINAIAFLSEAAMSAFADNVAAYLFGEELNLEFFRKTFGEDVFKTNEDVEDWICILAMKVAEQAGSLSKVGNGPNFSQQKIVFLMDPTNRQGIAINQVDMSMGESLPTQNYYSSLANLLLIAVSSGIMSQKIKGVKKPAKKEEAVQPK